jgi:hypothetical protein
MTIAADQDFDRRPAFANAADQMPQDPSDLIAGGRFARS